MPIYTAKSAVQKFRTVLTLGVIKVFETNLSTSWCIVGRSCYCCSCYARYVLLDGRGLTREEGRKWREKLSQAMQRMRRSRRNTNALHVNVV